MAFDFLGGTITSTPFTDPMLLMFGIILGILSIALFELGVIVMFSWIVDAIWGDNL